MYFFISLLPSFNVPTLQETDAGLWTNVPSHLSNIRSQSQLSNWRICLQRKAQDCFVWRREGLGDISGINAWLRADNRIDGDRLFVLLCERTRSNGQNMQKTKYCLGQAFLVQGWSNTGTGCSRVLISLHSWRYPKINWAHSWETCSRWPSLEQGLLRQSLVVPFVTPTIVLPQLWIFFQP